MKPAFDRAVGYLRARIAQCRSEQQRRLEPLAILAAFAGVSHVTMLKAIHTLREAGALATSHRYGTRIVASAGTLAPDTARRPPSATHNQAWERTMQAIRVDCTRGMYPPGVELPAAKTLCARYGVSHVTLSRALRALERDSDLQRCGRAWRRALPQLARTVNTIVLFARGRDSKQPMLSSQLDREEYLALEQECRRCQVGLHLVPWYYATPERVDGAGDLRRYINSASGRNLLGCIVWDRNMPARLCTEVESILNRSGLPYAALCSTGSPVANTRWEPSRTFHMGGRPGDGRVVGEYLLSLGHRRIVYIHPAGIPEWSPPRIEGIRLAFERYQPHTEVIEVKLESGTKREALVDTLYRRLARMGAEATRISNQVPVRGELDPHLRFLNRFVADISYMRNAMAQRAYLFALCERLLRLPGVSAWVGANDIIASGCVDYLGQRRIALPERLSVVGFDDSEAAMAQRMSSYNFNVTAYAQAMVERLIREQGGGRKASGVTTIDGYVQVRETSGAAQ